MAAEAQAEGPALPPPPLAHGSSSASASPEKRGLPIPGNDDGATAAEEEERRLLPEPKRRRACVAALDRVPSSVAEEDSPGSGCGGDGDGDGASFSFQHARGGFDFVAPETTPKFGSFNPPGEAELAGLVDLKPAGHEDEADAEGSTEADGEVPVASAPGMEARDESSQLVDGEVDGQLQANCDALV